MPLEPIAVLTSDEHQPTVAFAGGRLVLLGGGGVEVWDLATRALVHRIAGLVPGHVEDDEEAFPGESEPHGTGHLRVSADGRTAISWGGLRNVTVWHLDTGRRGTRFFHAADVTDAVLVADAVVSSAHPAHELVVWELASGAVRTRLAHAPIGATPEERAACADCAEARRTWEDDAEMCRAHGDLAGHDCAGALAVHPDGRRLVSGGNGVCAWDLERGWLGVMSPSGLSFTVAISSSGRVHAISEGRAGRALHVWRDVAGERLAEVLVVQPDQPVLAIRPGPSTILLETRFGAELHDLDGARLAAFEPPAGEWLPLPDGEHLVGKSHWSASPHRLIVARIRDGQTLAAVDAPSDGRLGAVSADGTVAYVDGHHVHLFAATVS